MSDYYNVDDVVGELKKLNKTVKMNQEETELLSSRAVITRELPNTLSFHEAILLLESMKQSFPDAEIESLCNQLEDKILLKAGVNMPKVETVR